MRSDSIGLAIHAVFIAAGIVLLSSFILIFSLLTMAYIDGGTVTIHFDIFNELFIELLLFQFIGTGVIAAALTFITNELRQ